MTHIVSVHSALVSLLTRHAQTLSNRASRTHTTLSSSEEIANILKPELSAIVITLQGLCLMDQRAKDELGQSWMLEVSYLALSPRGIADVNLAHYRSTTCPQGTARTGKRTASCLPHARSAVLYTGRFTHQLQNIREPEWSRGCREGS